jgi:hypothetical protein
MKLLRADLLDSKIQKEKLSYWKEKEAKPQSYERQF